MASTENATSSDADDKKTVVTSQAPSVVVKAEKSEPGAAWKADEEHVLPHNNMVLVFSALMLTLFLVCVLAMALQLNCTYATLLYSGGAGSNHVRASLASQVCLSS